MLGLNSIQRTAHRLEDFFKILKECPSIQIEQTLESLFLQVFDNLKALLELLQNGASLSDSEASQLMAEVEPVFAALEHQLSVLVGQAGGSMHPDESSLPAIAVDAHRPRADRPHQEADREHRRVLAGESWSQGQVLLAWDEVKRGAATPGDGHNVVIHEFAHQLDQAGGPANGAPALPSADAYRRWSTVMQNEFDALRWRLARGEPGLIDAYAATDPAEFFAVISELFFERPQAHQ